MRLVANKENYKDQLLQLSMECSQLILDNERVIMSVKPYSQTRLQEQNALQFHWYKELEQQGDMTANQYRNYCKYYFGLPIMVRESDELGRTYRKVLKAIKSYEERMILMEGMSVTSTFNTKEMAEYLTAVKRHFSQQGFYLTDKYDYR